MTGMYNLLAAALLVASVGAFASDDKESEPELVEQMRSLQYFMHKLQLSLEGNNLPLAKFYSHEVGEVIETLEQIDEYDGHRINQLAETILEPSFQRLDKTLQGTDIKQAIKDYDYVIHACNSCHISTEHGFIKIEKNSHNPYLQSFTRQD